MEKGTLYLVATPIGNLEDITLRAIRVLKEVNLIAAEDTRQTLKLLNHLEISKPLISYHRHNEDIKKNVIIEKLLNGENIAIVTDAGTPAISDPRRGSSKRSNSKWYKDNTNTRSMCFNKCINCFRFRYKRIFILCLFAIK